MPHNIPTEQVVRLNLKHGSQKETANELEALYPNEKPIGTDWVGAKLREAEERGILRHVVVGPTTELLPRLPELELELCRHLPLRDAVVVDQPLVQPEVDDWTKANQAHEALGRWGSRVLMCLLRPDDVIGVGSGRATYHSVHNTPKVRHRQAVVVSLSGHMNVKEWRKASGEQGPGLCMDADFVASALHGCIGAKNINTVHEDISGRGSRQHRKRLRATCRSVTLGLIGMAAVTEGQCLITNLNCPELQGAREEVKALLSRLEELEARYKGGDNEFHLLGDLCNYLFIADGPAKKLKPKELTALRAAVEKVNAELVTPFPEDIAAICQRGCVLGVAGGRHKADIMHRVLKNRWVTHLVTDRGAAQKILQLEGVALRF